MYPDSSGLRDSQRAVAALVTLLWPINLQDTGFVEEDAADQFAAYSPKLSQLARGVMRLEGKDAAGLILFNVI